MNRKTLKQYAKEKIKNNFWTAYIVGLIPSLIGFSSGIFEVIFKKPEYASNFADDGSFLVTIFVSLLSILISYLTLSFFMKNSKEKAELKDMVDGLTTNRYFDFVKVNFIVWVKTFLWTLLFIVPGIIKGLEYAFVPYIKMDHPEYTTDECFAYSKEITDGRKSDIFILQLSFLGWFILSTLTFGLVLPFTAAYQNQALADLYYDISEK